MALPSPKTRAVSFSKPKPHPYSDTSVPVSSVDEPLIRIWILTVIAVLGVIAAALCVSAELTRTSSYTYLMDFEGIFHCQYPASPASPMAYAAVGLLTVGQGVMTRFGGMGFLFSGPKHFLSRRLLVAILVALGVWSCYVIAISTLIVSAQENDYHTREKGGGFGSLKCSLVSHGTFLAACVFTSFTATLQLLYYFVAIQARWELWRVSREYSNTVIRQRELEAQPMGAMKEGSD